MNQPTTIEEGDAMSRQKKTRIDRLVVTGTSTGRVAVHRVEETIPDAYVDVVARDVRWGRQMSDQMVLGGVLVPFPVMVCMTSTITAMASTAVVCQQLGVAQWPAVLAGLVGALLARRSVRAGDAALERSRAATHLVADGRPCAIMDGERLDVAARKYLDSFANLDGEVDEDVLRKAVEAVGLTWAGPETMATGPGQAMPEVQDVVRRRTRG